MNPDCGSSKKVNVLLEENLALRSLLASSLETIYESEKIGRVFHDFNNILSSLMGYSSLATERGQAFRDEKLIRYLQNIERASIKARDLVRDNLDQRGQERTKSVCSIRQVLVNLVPSVEYELQRDAIYMDESAFTFLVYLVLNIAQAVPSMLHVKAQLVEFDSCDTCAEELPGEQLKIVFSQTDSNFIDELSVTLAEMLVKTRGGHMCLAQGKDGETIIYLRAAPE